MKTRPGWVDKLLDRLLERAASCPRPRGRLRPIRELHIEWTRRCSLRCVMCHHWRFPAAATRELSAAEIVSAVRGSSLLADVDTVVLTGGEPWLKPGLVGLAAFFLKRYPKARVGILTSLWDYGRIRAGLRRLAPWAGRVWLGSSMDGVGSAHDAVRGRPGAFRRMLRAAELLRREFPALELSFNHTITPLNLKELWPAYRFMSERGFWFGAQLAVNHEGLPAPRFRWKKAELLSIRRQIDLIIDDLCRREKLIERLIRGGERECAGALARVLYWRGLQEYVLRPRRLLSDCLAGERWAMLDPEGGVFFCPVNKHRPVGNIRRAPFDRIWRCARARAERAFARSGACHCWLLCTANPVLDRIALGGADTDNC